MDLRDISIIEDVLSGNDAAFGELVDRHLAPLYAFSFRYVRNGEDAQDVAQEAFVRAWKHLRKFDRTKNFKTWLFTIAKNAALDHLKKKKAITFSAVSEDEEALAAFFAPYADGGPSPDELFDRTEEEAGLARAIEELPAAYQTVLRMRYQGGLKFREIADTLREPIDTIKSKHRRALILLKKSTRESIPGDRQFAPRRI